MTIDTIEKSTDTNDVHQKDESVPSLDSEVTKNLLHGFLTQRTTTSTCENAQSSLSMVQTAALVQCHNKLMEKVYETSPFNNTQVEDYTPRTLQQVDQ